MKRLIAFFVTACALLLLINSCKKDGLISSPDARIYFSADTLKFDTVLTSTASITQSVKIFNDNDQRLRLSAIKLMGGPASAYKINVNGQAATEVNDIDVAANDSVYIFVTVTIDPTTANLPFIITDSVLVSYNGNDRFIQLEAFGQNAHFLRNERISVNSSWTNDLPYVILDGLEIDSNVNLTIGAGCRIYSHANAPFIVKGILKVNGSKGNEVQFASNRLDMPYRDYPAGWPGIYFTSSSADNSMNFAVIRNAYQAIAIQGPSINSNPKLRLQQCIIDNAYDAGILSINSNLVADNCLIMNCGKNIRIALGGTYRFTHCTVATYSNAYLLHKDPVLVAENSFNQNGITLTADMDASFVNCILWGDDGTVEDEVVLSRQGSTNYQVTFDHCLYRALHDPVDATFDSVLKNMDPAFDSIDVSHRYYDFRVTKDPFAPGLEQGKVTPLPTDLDDNPRAVGIPDLGSYEKQ